MGRGPPYGTSAAHQHRLLGYRSWSGRERARACAGWRPASGGRGPRFSTRVGRGQRAPFDSLNLGVLTDDADAAVIENRRRLARGARDRARRGSRSASRSTGPSSSPSTPRPQRPESRIAETRHASLEPEVDGQSSPGPAWRRWSSPPTACRWRSPGRAGVAMLHCGWRGLAAGIVARGRRGGRRDRRRDRPRHRPLLLRGRRRGPRCLRPASASGIAESGRTTMASTFAEVARRLLARGGVERVEIGGALHQLRAGALLLPPPRRRADRAPGRVWPGSSADGPRR